MPRFMNLTGMRFNSFQVLTLDHKRGNSTYVFKCKCDCGNEVLVQGGNLRTGHSKSCGCLNKKTNKYCNLTNGTTIVELTQGQWTILDTAVWEQIKHHKWIAHFAPNTGTFYAITQINRKSIQMGRLILGLTDRYEYSDHINHDTLDNRTENLRVSTNTQNQWNRDKQCNSEAIELGVSICKEPRKDGCKLYYRANMSSYGKKYNSPRFPFTEEGKQQAIAWRLKMEENIQGEFSFKKSIDKQ